MSAAVERGAAVRSAYMQFLAARTNSPDRRRLFRPPAARSQQVEVPANGGPLEAKALRVRSPDKLRPCCYCCRIWRRPPPHRLHRSFPAGNAGYWTSSQKKYANVAMFQSHLGSDRCR